MSDDRPAAPADLPEIVVDALDELDPDQLRSAARYAERLADHEDRGGRREGESDEDDVEDPGDDPPEGVPAKATLTTKTINGNRYYYWQWRDGETVTSKYEGPVHPSE